MKSFKKSSNFCLSFYIKLNVCFMKSVFYLIYDYCYRVEEIKMNRKLNEKSISCQEKVLLQIFMDCRIFFEYLEKKNYKFFNLSFFSNTYYIKLIQKLSKIVQLAKFEESLIPHNFGLGSFYIFHV